MHNFDDTGRIPSQNFKTALNVTASFLFLAIWFRGLKVDGLTAAWSIHVSSALCDLFLRDYSVDFLTLKMAKLLTSLGHVGTRHVVLDEAVLGGAAGLLVPRVGDCGGDHDGTRPSTESIRKLSC